MIIRIADQLIREYKKAVIAYSEADSMALKPEQRVQFCEKEQELKRQVWSVIEKSIWSKEV